MYWETSNNEPDWTPPPPKKKKKKKYLNVLHHNRTQSKLVSLGKLRMLDHAH